MATGLTLKVQQGSPSKLAVLSALAAGAAKAVGPSPRADNVLALLLGSIGLTEIEHWKPVLELDFVHGHEAPLRQWCANDP